MLRRIGSLILISYFVYIGGILPFVQTFAWAFHGYEAALKHYSLRQAIEEVFEPDQCPLCRFIQRNCITAGRSFTYKTNHIPSLDAQLFMLRFGLFLPPRFEGISTPEFFRKDFFESPPNPPPKLPLA